LIDAEEPGGCDDARPFSEIQKPVSLSKIVHVPQHRRSPRHLSVADGRDALGVVKVADGSFTAVDVNGIEIGTFASLREALRAFDERAAR
jgi:hypothetical protein